MARGHWEPKEKEKVRGRLQFLSLQTFGRVGKVLSATLNPGGATLEDEDFMNLEWIAGWLEGLSPRLVSPGHDDPPVLLFTDGACESEGHHIQASFGAVLFDRRDGSRWVFGGSVNESLKREWSEDGRKQLVTEAELLPILLARRVWKERLQGAKLIVFVDSEPALFSCIKGCSRTPSCNDIVRAIAFEEGSAQTWSWYSRVPSAANPADQASRSAVLECADRWNAR
eukprot:6482092-Amphidinium_carterae.1